MAKRVLLLGASGFLGSKIALDLVESGFDVSALGRDLDYGKRILPMLDWRKGDLRELTRPGDWPELLQGVDAIVNASGVLQTGLRDNVEAVQSKAILALAEAARKAGIKRFVQISAASADCQLDNEFMATKAQADAALLNSGLEAFILRPGLVIGRNPFGGNELIRMAAAMPIALYPRNGETIQCVALSDVAEAVRKSLSLSADRCGQYDLVEDGGQALVGVIAQHRDWLGYQPAWFSLGVPSYCFRPVSWLADALGWLGWRSPLRRNAIAALSFGVKGNSSQGPVLLGRPLLSLEQALRGIGQAGKADRWHARIGPVYPAALLALILLWLGSGLLGLWKTAEAVTLLKGQIGDAAARPAVLVGSVADILIAIGILFHRSLKPALCSSLLLSMTYVAGSVIFRPDLWLDPLAPMLKVIPAILLSCVCLALADER